MESKGRQGEVNRGKDSGVEGNGGMDGGMDV